MPATLLHAERLTRRHGDRTILDAIDLRVGAGDRLAIVGPNGAGKSTLLRLLAGAEQPDSGAVRRWTEPLYLPQPGRRPTDRTPLRDAVAERLGIGGASRALDAAAAALTAAGAAFAAPVAVGAPASGEYSGRGRAASERPTGETPAGESDLSPDEAMDRAVAAHAEALDAWLAAGGGTLDADLLRAAERIRLPAELLDRPLGELSSGQASRAALLAVAAQPRDVVLLDEPSNHLDASGRALLDELLDSHRGALVLASHDRALLARHAVRVVEIDPHTGKLDEHAGGWEAHERERAAAKRKAQADYDTAVQRRSELQDAEREIRRRAAATRGRVANTSRDGDKHVKEWFAARADGVAARGRVVGARAERVVVPDRPWQDRALALELTPEERQGWLVELEGAVAIRGDWSSAPWTLGVRAGDRILLRGPNGAGKSTLLALLAGTLEPVRGTRRAAAGVVISALGTVDQALSAPAPLVEVVRSLTGLDQAEAHGRLAHVGLGPDAVSRPAATLSQGERTRAELAVLGAQRTACLLLDEPTDHLDLASIEAVEAALDGWPGAVVVATHDTRFAERLGAGTVIDVG